MRAQFQQFHQQAREKYDTFRDEANRSYARFIEQAWQQFRLQEAQPVPERPEPPQPIRRAPDRPITDDPILFGEIVPLPTPLPRPKPIIELPEQPEIPEPQPAIPEQRPETPSVPAAEPSFRFAFYGTPCVVPLTETHRFALRGVDEGSVAAGWKILSEDRFTPVVERCIEARDRWQLSDWGYVRFLEQMTMAFWGAASRNEARLMQMYLLTQSGYKVRIARYGQQLALLLPARENVYRYPFLTIDNERYFLFDEQARGQSVYLCNHAFPRESILSLRMDNEPLLLMVDTPKRTLSAQGLDMPIELSLNRNLIDFYNDYPVSDAWHLYALRSLSDRAKQQLYPHLRKAIAGKSEREGAEILLHFVQTAFDYQTDDEQFGEERPLFADETLFYPYSDCEDRSILYAVLMRELMHLDVVLLHYPGHLATAVHFSDEVAGDHLQLEGVRYTVCDPTYIGAGVGEAMPNYKQVAARVIRIE